MDVDKEYIKMCEKADEIWYPHHMEIGDYFLALEENRTVGICTERIDNFVYSPNLKHGNEDNNCIWLPRQDQLQEIWADHIYDKERANNWVTFVIDQFSYWVLNEDVGFSALDASFEQLWLAFVMKEKFNKTWTGEEWSDSK
jgi:hypothetical protein